MYVCMYYVYIPTSIYIYSNENWQSISIKKPGMYIYIRIHICKNILLINKNAFTRRTINQYSVNIYMLYSRNLNNIQKTIYPVINYVQSNGFTMLNGLFTKSLYLIRYVCIYVYNIYWCMGRIPNIHIIFYRYYILY